ncbi:hypothetical protein POJ06DRAFT_255453 [Lipomyces tetrasporus]|uniref:Uncharacterized protein n=1 Tax=Lipomyces tetrasporus TaxID=54092 RepID=A0AAD7QRK8_9ASCO|nr:uncharacterized protein POJ06DRAFT_255453 [Lipomyces tetrasporus]KAJ8100115.1 hypothetical protein POJ06DRAFT_255453 [Lipomyces tetrasporus]
MEYKYTPEELKDLAESPLSVRPERLKPNEEWMGPPILQTNPPKANLSKPDRDRGEDDPLRKYNSHISKDKKPISSRSKQDDIVLGPPKISFGSSSGLRKGAESDNADKSTESIDLDSSFARRIERSRDASGSSSLSTGSRLSASSRPQPSRTSNTSYGRRSTREEDGDDWKEVSSRHPRKSFGADDSEKFRKSKDDERGLKSESLNRDRRSRDVSGAVRRDEVSWRERDPEKERDRRETYPRDTKGERHSTISNRYMEKSPEWMDAPAENDGLNFSNSEFAHAVGNSNLASSAAPPSTTASSLKSLSGGPTAHSIEEFQAWKARMKAADDERKGIKDTKPESLKNDLSVAESDSKAGLSSYSSGTGGVDRFFGFVSQAVTTDEIKELSAGIESTKVKSPTEGPRSSRFSSFFKPEQISTPSREHSREELVRSPENSAPSIMSKLVARHEDSPSSAEVKLDVDSLAPKADDDKEGFKRIMVMLGTKSNKSSRNTTPAPVESADGKVLAVAAATNFNQPEIETVPSSEGQNAGDPPIASRSNSSAASDKMEASNPNKDSSNAQFLMGLMSQSSKMRIQRQQSPQTLPGPETSGPLAPPQSQQHQHQHQLPMMHQKATDANGQGQDVCLPHPPPGIGRSPGSFNDVGRLGPGDPRLQPLQPLSQPLLQWAVPPLGSNGLRMLGPHGNQRLLTPMAPNAQTSPPGRLVSPNANSGILSPQLSSGMDAKSSQDISKQQLRSDGLGGPGNAVGQQQGYPPFPTGMIPPGVNLPPFPPGGLPPYFGMHGPPPPFPAGFPPPHLQHDPNLGMPPLPNMLPGGARAAPPNGMPPFAFGPPPPGLGFNRVSGNMEGGLTRGATDPQVSGK